MARIDMQNLDAILIEKLSDPLKIGPITYKHRVVTDWDEPVVVVVDHVHSVAEIQKGSRYLPGLPSVRMVIRHGLARLQEKGRIVEANQDAANWPVFRLASADSPPQAHHLLRHLQNEVPQVAQEN